MSVRHYTDKGWMQAVCGTSGCGAHGPKVIVPMRAGELERAHLAVATVIRWDEMDPEQLGVF